MLFYIKIIIVYIARLILRTFYIFPVKKNRILFSAYEGIAYTCNPKYIFQYVYEKDNDKWEYIWCLNNPTQLPEKYCKYTHIVSFLSMRHIYYLLTSKIIISNLGIEPIIPKRKNQIFINTWHGGGAYKRNQADLKFFTKAESLYVRYMRDIRKNETDYFISSCEAFTRAASEGFNIEFQRFLPVGLPRNDILFEYGKTINRHLRESIAIKYKLNPNFTWVLYAPTFRGTFRKQTNIENEVCNEKVINSLKKRFNRDIILITRAHTPHIYLNGGEQNNCIVDLTDYPDMQELLSVADVLITDYSSSIWDYALTGRPGFLYTPDLSAYEGSRGFYTPIELWPYSYAANIEDFCEIIENYDVNKSLEKIEAHYKLLESYEDGTASRKIWTLLSTFIK